MPLIRGKCFNERTRIRTCRLVYNKDGISKTFSFRLVREKLWRSLENLALVNLTIAIISFRESTERGHVHIKARN